MILDKLKYISHKNSDNFLVSEGPIFTVVQNDTCFEIKLFVAMDKLCAEYHNINRSNLIHTVDTIFTFTPTEEAIDLVDIRGCSTVICDILPGVHDDAVIKLKNASIKLKIYPDGGIEALKVSFDPEE